MSARPFGFCVGGTRRRGRKFTGLRLKAWVRPIRASRKFRNGSETNHLLFSASYGSYPAQSLAWQYASNRATTLAACGGRPSPTTPL